MCGFRGVVASACLRRWIKDVVAIGFLVTGFAFIFGDFYGSYSLFPFMIVVVVMITVVWYQQ